MSKIVGKVFNLTGGGSGGSLKLQEISITNPPSKTVYKSGETFDPTGLVISAGYGYGLTSDVTGYTVSPSVLTDGVTSVTVAYTENRVTKTIAIPVTVEKVLASIVVTTPPSKTAYSYLESFNPAGMAVDAVFSDGSRAAASGYSYPSTSFTALGKQTVGLSYTYEGVTKSVTLEVTVNAIQVPVPVQNGTLTYNGGTKTPSWSGYDAAKMTLSGVTNGTNAGEYTAKFTLAYGYAFPGGSGEASVKWRIGRASIAAVPTQSGALAADGTQKSPSWSGYDTNKLTISGTLTGAKAGTYTASFTPTANYQWWDGSTGAKNASWTISSIIVPIPTQNGSLTYTGAVQTPSWNNFDTANSTVSVTGAANAGEYTAAFSLLRGTWSDGTTANKTVKWSIGRATIAAVPAQSGSLTYDGNPKTPSWNSNYDSTKMTLSVEAKTLAGSYNATFTPTANYKWSDGSTSAKTVEWSIERAAISAVPSQIGTLTYTGGAMSPSWRNYNSSQLTFGGSNVGVNAGSYNARFTPTANYKWSDGSTGAKTVAWSIGKAAGSLTLSKTVVALTPSDLTQTVTVTRAGNGTITASSDNTSVATVSVSGTTITIQSVNNASGTATITVQVAASTNYTSPTSKTISVNAQFIAIYGVEWDWENSSSSKGVRTDAAANFPDPSPAVDNGTGSSPFDNIMPWAGMVKETRDGGVEVKEPKFWFKWTKTGKKLKLQIADGPVEGFHVDPVNMDRGDGLGELDFSYIGRYHCASGTYKSKTNDTQQVGITRSAARTSIHNLGANFWQMDFAQMWYVGMLYLVEFADWDGQKTIGDGGRVRGSAQKNGYTDVMQYHTGLIDPRTPDVLGVVIQYRNIESWWGITCDWLDGCYYNIDGLNIILNPNLFSEKTNGIPVGIPSSGFPSDFEIPTKSGLEWALFPCSSTGTTSTYIPDKWSFYEHDEYLCHGGDSSAKNSGPFFVSCYSIGQDTSEVISCRLQERPPKAV